MEVYYTLVINEANTTIFTSVEQAGSKKMCSPCLELQSKVEAYWSICVGKFRQRFPWRLHKCLVMVAKNSINKLSGVFQYPRNWLIQLGGIVELSSQEISHRPNPFLIFKKVTEGAGSIRMSLIVIIYNSHI